MPRRTYVILFFLRKFSGNRSSQGKGDSSRLRERILADVEYVLRETVHKYHAGILTANI